MSLHAFIGPFIPANPARLPDTPTRRVIKFDYR